MRRLVLPWLGLVALLSTGAIAGLDVSRPALGKEKPTYGLDDKDILLYVEAITQIKERAWGLSPAVTRARMVEESLRGYLALKGVCCDYLSRDQYRAFKDSLKESYIGIGLEIRSDQEGRIICYPQPDGPAARAGISAGSRLKKIDGVPVEGKSVFVVAGLTRGKPGTELTAVVATSAGEEREVRITRSAVALPSVVKRVVEGTPIIAVGHFTRDTSGKIRDILRSWERDAPIVVDVRGNGGGDVHAAIDSAMLFLKEGKRVATVESRTGTKTYDSRAGVSLTSPVYVWQDEGTASAAEVFVAALTDNDRAVSIGRATAGKASLEEIIELSDGSALVLATGTLQTPRGFQYEGKGLKPGHELREGGAETANYVAKVRELVGAKTGRSR